MRHSLPIIFLLFSIRLFSQTLPDLNKSYEIFNKATGNKIRVAESFKTYENKATLNSKIGFRIALVKDTGRYIGNKAAIWKFSKFSKRTEDRNLEYYAITSQNTSNIVLDVPHGSDQNSEIIGYEFNVVQNQFFYLVWTGEGKYFYIISYDSGKAIGDFSSNAWTPGNLNKWRPIQTILYGTDFQKWYFAEIK
jgi:Ricin-type beta-trefoil lectin domain-like